MIADIIVNKNGLFVDGIMTTLLDITCGDQARIVRLSQLVVDNRRLLLAMGLVPGVVLTLLRVAPFGDPLIVQVLGTQLILCKKEASNIWVEAIPSCT